MPQLRNASSGLTLSHRVERATSPWRRTVGFLLLAKIESQRGLWFGRCRAIHTVGMRSAVDLVFLDADGIVVALEPNVRPNRPIVGRRDARAVVEMGPNFLRDAQVRLGDQLTLT